jgi:DNA (cytosine-5)-methyltransferase 1
MFKVVETFSGIGSQAKALENIGIEHKILYTADWDINAIIAYDLIHNGKQDLKKYERLSREEIINKLNKYTLSMNGKKPATKRAIQNLKYDVIIRLLASIERTNNLVSITDVKGKQLPNDVDLLTYSFPCQDLSVAGFWHGNKGGIDREAHNRSGMLWEIERILKERVESNLQLPKFLLMENVSAILTNRHKQNFEEWTNYLKEIGYTNHIYTLNASDFGIPQKRVRTYMVSVFTNNNKDKENQVERFFEKNNLEKKEYVKSIISKHRNLEDDILKLNYKNKQYRKEACECQPNDTESRREIYKKNDILYTNNKVNNIIVSTVTTKQDRHPNSGLIDYVSKDSSKSNYRYLTPRECFLLMGFDERDFQRIIDNNFNSRKNEKFFTRDKLYKMAGNSIVVNVLEEIFKQIVYIEEEILTEKQSTTIDILKEQIKLVNSITSKEIKHPIFT